MIFFFFNDTATTEIYTLSLHDALPISSRQVQRRPAEHPEQPEQRRRLEDLRRTARRAQGPSCVERSEEHTSELQSRQYLVCRLLLEKKKKTYIEIKSYYTRYPRLTPSN